MMRTSLLLAAVSAAAFAIPAAGAMARPGYVTANLHLRAGPSLNFPAVDTIPDGARVNIHGCLSGYSWCDVGWDGERGWADGNYLQFSYRGRRVLIVNYGDEIDVPVVGFSIGTYWRHHYRHRAFFGRLDYWRHHWHGDHHGHHRHHGHHEHRGHHRGPGHYRGPMSRHRHHHDHHGPGAVFGGAGSRFGGHHGHHEHHGHHGAAPMGPAAFGHHGHDGHHGHHAHVGHAGGPRGHIGGHHVGRGGHGHGPGPAAGGHHGPPGHRGPHHHH